MNKSLGVTVLALALFVGLGATWPNTKYVVEAGKTYRITSGSEVIQVKILFQMNNGWWMVQGSDGKELAINVPNAFTVQEVK